jgi:hypothetical protein
MSQEPEGGGPRLASGHWQLGLALEKLGHKQDAITEDKPPSSWICNSNLRKPI